MHWGGGTGINYVTFKQEVYIDYLKSLSPVHFKVGAGSVFTHSCVGHITVNQDFVRPMKMTGGVGGLLSNNKEAEVHLYRS